jgi:hypothetical protein
MRNYFRRVVAEELNIGFLQTDRMERIYYRLSPSEQSRYIDWLEFLLTKKPAGPIFIRNLTYEVLNQFEYHSLIKAQNRLDFSMSKKFIQFLMANQSDYYPYRRQEARYALMIALVYGSYRERVTGTMKTVTWFLSSTLHNRFQLLFRHLFR